MTDKIEPPIQAVKPLAYVPEMFKPLQEQGYRLWWYSGSYNEDDKTYTHNFKFSGHGIEGIVQFQKGPNDG